MTFKNLLLLIVLVLFSNVAYSQVSICQLGKDRHCDSWSYLWYVSNQRHQNDDYVYDRESKYFKFGYDHGISDSFKLSILPVIEIESANEIRPFAIGFQTIWTRPTSSVSNTRNPTNVGSTANIKSDSNTIYPFLDSDLFVISSVYVGSVYI